ncbi:unnamed protein product [Adineta ricciae]|uniref:EGF-like domain-containing protein n=1 Tax=Adineta ricciae TaxID=249248 RepID=A0A814FJU5_ADIRI|nr:unnamed protein product [Adineta ricciae]
MSPRSCSICLCLVLVSIINLSATSPIHFLEEDIDNENAQFKRFLFHPKTISSESDILNNLIHSSSFSNPKTVDSSLEPCAINPCENGGICLSNAQMKYVCQCPKSHYGQHCDKSFRKHKGYRQQSSLYEFSKQMKRDMNAQDDSDEDEEERAQYDFRNGIYF